MEENKEDRVSRLRQICELIGDNDIGMDKNFYVVNHHGYETDEDFNIPSGIRIIMFCYSGKILKICPKFDKFIWDAIMTNPDASYNYCTFLSNIAQYSSIRNHFCVYEGGQTIKNLMFENRPDDYWIHGIFNLPVDMTVRINPEKYITTNETNVGTFGDADVEVNPKKAVKAARTGTPYTIRSHVIYPGATFVSLKETVNEIIEHGDRNFTLLLFTCRSGKKQNIIKGYRIRSEIQKIYDSYLEKKNNT
jgi:hypothetical protein